MTAERPAAEPGICTDLCTLSALPAASAVKPAAASYDGAPGASLPPNEAALPSQALITATSEHISDGEPQQRGAGSPSVSEPLTVLQSSQPAATERADECVEDASSPAEQQSAENGVSLAAQGPATHTLDAAAVAANMTAEHCTAGSMSVAAAKEQQAACLDAESPNSFAEAGPGSAPPADVTEAAVDAQEVDGGNASAAGVDVACSPEPAEGTSQGPGVSAMDDAHLPVQLAASHQDDTVNVTSASPRCVSPGASPGLVLGDGLTCSPSGGRSAAAAFAAVAQHIHEHDDDDEAGAQLLTCCMLACVAGQRTGCILPYLSDEWVSCHVG